MMKIYRTGALHRYKALKESVGRKGADVLGAET